MFRKAAMCPVLRLQQEEEAGGKDAEALTVTQLRNF